MTGTLYLMDINEIDLKALWNELDIYENELDKESAALSQVWNHMLEAKDKLQQEAERSDTNQASLTITECMFACVID